MDVVVCTACSKPGDDSGAPGAREKLICSVHGGGAAGLNGTSSTFCGF